MRRSAGDPWVPSLISTHIRLGHFGVVYLASNATLALIPHFSARGCQSRSAETPEAKRNKINCENGSKNNFAVVIDESRSGIISKVATCRFAVCNASSLQASKFGCSTAGTL
jgi:hypothetical protein